MPASKQISKSQSWSTGLAASPSRSVVYNELPATPIDTGARLTTETRRQADLLFDGMIRQRLKAYKIHDKRAWFRHLMHAAKIAGYHNGVVMLPRNINHPDCSKARLQVTGAAVEAGLFIEYRSSKGSPKMSRLLPVEGLKEFTSTDPWTFDPDRTTQYVILRDRNTKEEIPFDPNLEVPALVQKRLEFINAVNGQYEISCQKWNKWASTFTERKRLRPIHFARFTDTFDLHGRLYTGKYDHQGLRKFERKTIQFDSEPSVELDYGGLHPRMLYHLEGIDYRGDPYALWGNGTTEPQRLLAKRLLNALINAKTPEAAVDACNRKMSLFTKERGVRKTGKALEDAHKLYSAQKETGLRFKEMVPLAMERHRRIRHRFGCDMGIKLMRIDSAIALDVLHNFAMKGIPCLGVHDSFIVPQAAKRLLKRVMLRTYREHVGYLPTVK